MTSAAVAPGAATTQPHASCLALLPQRASQSAGLRLSRAPALRAGFGQKAAAEGDEAALKDLLHACLGGNAELHARLASLMVRASSAAESCRTSGTPKASWQPVCDILSTAVSSLKQQVPHLPKACAAGWAAVNLSRSTWCMFEHRHGHTHCPMDGCAHKAAAQPGIGYDALLDDTAYVP